MLVLILPTQERWKAELTLSRKGHPNFRPSTRPGIKLGNSGLGNRDFSTAPIHFYVLIQFKHYHKTESSIVYSAGGHCNLHVKLWLYSKLTSCTLELLYFEKNIQVKTTKCSHTPSDLQHVAANGLLVPPHPP